MASGNAGREDHQNEEAPSNALSQEREDYIVALRRRKFVEQQSSCQQQHVSSAAASDFDNSWNKSSADSLRKMSAEAVRRSISFASRSVPFLPPFPLAKFFSLFQTAILSIALVINEHGLQNFLTQMP